MGLTATPKDEVDANTYHIFGCEAGTPNYDYSLDDAVHDKYFVGYAVKNRTSEMISKGIDLKKLSDDELEQLEEYFDDDPPTPDFNIPGNEIFKYLFNEEYSETTDISNLAAFVRSLIGLSQEAVNEKFGEYLNGNTFNSQQQEFIMTIINYVRENGDIELEDMVNTEPFNNYDLNEMFGVNLAAVVSIVNVMHNSVITK